MPVEGAKPTPPSDSCREQAARDQRRRLLLEVAALLAAALVYVAYERIGTVANASTIELTPDYSGGFFAIGMTEDQPGFLVLSNVELREVDVRAERASNDLSGDRTVASVTTPWGSWRQRLRGPVVVLIHADGSLDAVPVDWSVAEFNMLRAATDCSLSGKRRCGAPLLETTAVLASWPSDRVPQKVREFLANSRNDRNRHGHEHAGKT